MKDFHQKWKTFLLCESAKNIEDLEYNDKLFPGHKSVVYTKRLDNEQGFYYGLIPEHAELKGKNLITAAVSSERLVHQVLTIERASYGGYGPCLDGWMVSWSRADPGWGPLLYDVAMEWASDTGGGLMPDRHSVSPSAKAVWDYYFKKRKDIQWLQLDTLESPPKKITPRDPSDDCSQESTFHWVDYTPSVVVPELETGKWFYINLSAQSKEYCYKILDKAGAIDIIETPNMGWSNQPNVLAFTGISDTEAEKALHNAGIWAVVHRVDWGRDNKEWRESSLSKIYRTKGMPTIDALIKAGRWLDI